MTEALDNAVWYALTGPRQPLGTVVGGAGRFAPEVSPFAALTDDPDPGDWADLAALLGAGRAGALFRAPVDLPPGWEVQMRIPCVQMVATGVRAEDDDAFIDLGAADVPEMLALVEETKPGPFGPRTVEFGGYIGVRDGDGQLVAMAGERLRCGGFTEISAVCTAPSQQGRGLGTLLVRALVHRIRARGEQAFLHASVTNVNAIRLYDALGFDVRRELDAVVVRAPR